MCITDIPNAPPVGQIVSFTLDLTQESALIGKTFYCAIKTTVSGKSGTVSNIARIFVERKETSFFFNQSSQQIPSKKQPSDEFMFKKNLTFNEISKDFIIIAAAICLAVLMTISIICFCCRKRRKHVSKTEKTLKKTDKINVILPQSNSAYNSASSQYQSNDFANQIGLPSHDDEMTKPPYLGQNRHFDAQYTQHQSIIYSDGTLRRNERFLSPIESWTASQLLFYHEQDQRSPLANDSSLHIDYINFESVPPIPPYPNFCSDFTADPPLSEANYAVRPPQYSTVHRTMLSDEHKGSLLSISGTLNGDKKVRNVTMV